MLVDMLDSSDRVVAAHSTPLPIDACLINRTLRPRYDTYAVNRIYDCEYALRETQAERHRLM